MKLTASDVGKFESFLARLRGDVYPEPQSELHSQITRQMLTALLGKYPLATGTRVLDIGCGQGVALRLFQEHELNATGITLGEDAVICQQLGFDVREMDQSFLSFEDSEFGLVWSRHCLEHSVMPFFTLSEMFRVLEADGYCYIEVPAPDTPCYHQRNLNHYSVFTASMWSELIRRSGFEILDLGDIRFETPIGSDVYHYFIAHKPR